MDKAKSARDFLRSLEDPKITMDLMTDRIDIQVLGVINEYAELIAKVKSGLDIKDLTSCSLIIGFLLKGHLDRYELSQQLKLSLGE